MLGEALFWEGGLEAWNWETGWTDLIVLALNIRLGSAKKNSSSWLLGATYKSPSHVDYEIELMNHIH